jgi:endonuclease/exonuclease/phosphatase (EEP) superfamily protein YafD
VRRAGAGRYWLVWAAVLPIAAWALVRMAGVGHGYPFVPLLAYTPYVALAAFFVAGLVVALRNWAAAAVTSVALALLLAAVLPRAVGGSERMPAGAAELRVLSVNVHHGTADPAAVVGLAARLDADLLCVQELTPSFAVELKRSGLPGLLPRRVLSVRRGASGGGLYSRLPIGPIVAPRTIGSAFRMPRAVVTLDNGAVARVVDVHPYPPKRHLVGLWRAQFATLPGAEPDVPAPWVLAGDFNGTLDFPELRDLLDTGYRDAAEVTGDGLEPTWPAGRVLPPPVTIDHVIADQRIAVLGFAVEDVRGTDHHAVFARLAVPRVVGRG